MICIAMIVSVFAFTGCKEPVNNESVKTDAVEESEDDENAKTDVEEESEESQTEAPEEGFTIDNDLPGFWHAKTIIMDGEEVDFEELGIGFEVLADGSIYKYELHELSYEEAQTWEKTGDMKIQYTNDYTNEEYEFELSYEVIDGIGHLSWDDGNEIGIFVKVDKDEFLAQAMVEEDAEDIENSELTAVDFEDYEFTISSNIWEFKHYEYSDGIIQEMDYEDELMFSFEGEFWETEDGVDKSGTWTVEEGILTLKYENGDELVFMTALKEDAANSILYFYFVDNDNTDAAYVYINKY